MKNVGQPLKKSCNSLSKKQGYRLPKIVRKVRPRKLHRQEGSILRFFSLAKNNYILRVFKQIKIRLEIYRSALFIDLLVKHVV